MQRFCGTCPTFKLNRLNEVKPHALFCARGKSSKPTDQSENNGCFCPTCSVFEKYDLIGEWFCTRGNE